MAIAGRCSRCGANNASTFALCAVGPQNYTYVDSYSGCSVCLAGFQSINGACTGCPPGRFGADGLVCSRCPAGTHSATIAAPSSLSCQPCSNGSFSQAGASVCSLCAPNAVPLPSGAGCTCGPGFFAANNTRNGSLNCTACVGNTFAPSGSSSCARCNDNAVALDDHTACQCSFGFAASGGSLLNPVCKPVSSVISLSPIDDMYTTVGYTLVPFRVLVSDSSNANASSIVLQPSSSNPSVLAASSLVCAPITKPSNAQSTRIAFLCSTQPTQLLTVTGLTVVTLSASDALGNVASRSFGVTVNPLPSASTIDGQSALAYTTAVTVGAKLSPIDITFVGGTLPLNVSAFDSSVNANPNSNPVPVSGSSALRIGVRMVSTSSNPDHSVFSLSISAASLTASDVAALSQHTVTVLATDALGATTSTRFVVSLNMPPSVTASATLLTLAPNQQGLLTVALSGGTPPLSVSCLSSNASVLPIDMITVIGVGSNREIDVTPQQLGSTRLTVLVTDSLGAQGGAALLLLCKSEPPPPPPGPPSPSIETETSAAIQQARTEWVWVAVALAVLFVLLLLAKFCPRGEHQWCKACYRCMERLHLNRAQTQGGSGSEQDQEKQEQGDGDEKTEQEQEQEQEERERGPITELSPLSPHGRTPWSHGTRI